MTATPPPRTVGERVLRVGVMSWALIGILLLLYIIVRYLISPLSVIFPPLAIALVVTYLLNPLVSKLERRGVRRGLSVLAIYTLFLAVVGVALAFLIPLIGRQLTGFIEEVPNYATRVVDSVNDFAADRGFEFRVQVTSDEIFQAVQDNREAIVRFLGGVRSVAGQILHIVITLVIALILSIYLLLDLPKIQRAVTKAIPVAQRDEVLGLLDRVGSALGGFFRGQLLVALFVGVASAVGLTLVKLPFAVLIGFLAGIFNLIPLIGPFLAAVPAVIVGVLSDDPMTALWAGVVLLVVQQIDNHIISPNVMGRTVRLHPITVMLALLAGGTIAGVLGMLVVIPGVAAAKIVAQYMWSRRHDLGVSEPVPEPTGGS